MKSGKTMPDVVGITVYYDAPYEKRRTLLEAAARAVGENWRRFADEWSDPEPEYRAHLDEWMRASTSDKLHWIDFSNSEDYEDYGEAYLDIFFSPLSMHVLSIVLRCHHDDTLSVTFFANKKVLNEPVGMREYQRMEERKEQIEQQLSSGKEWIDTLTQDELSAWDRRCDELLFSESVGPQNEQCLLHVAEVAAAALPVRKVDTGEKLKS